jgi:hypothetical protein
MTLKQYYDYITDQIYQKNKDEGITKKEIIELYPLKTREQEYFKIILEAVKNDLKIPKNVLDNLTKLQRYRIFHDFSSYTMKYYIDYIYPEYRNIPEQNFIKRKGRPVKKYKKYVSHIKY